jgi:DNA-binding transcriptional MerR regulator
MTNNPQYRIGDITQRTGLSADTLRYYEKIGLLDKIGRTPAGVRSYTDRDLSKLRFIQRAKSMNFSLDEIGRLLEMRADPQHAREEIRQLAHRKLDEIEQQRTTLDMLHRELTLLVNLCRGTADGCPIMEGLDGHTKPLQQPDGDTVEN